MDSKNIYWDWNPLLSVGPFKFGESAIPFIQEYNLQELEKPFQKADWNSYEFTDCETRIYTNEDSEIERIGCFDNIYYEGQNLFGLTLEEVQNILGKADKIGEIIEYDIEDDKFEAFSVEFERFGAQIWFENSIVDSVMAHGFLDDN